MCIPSGQLPPWRSSKVLFESPRQTAGYLRPDDLVQFPAKTVGRRIFPRFFHKGDNRFQRTEKTTASYFDRFENVFEVPRVVF